MTPRHRQPAWSLHTQQPTMLGPLAEYGIELAMRLAGDYDEPGCLEYARVSAGWSADVWAERIDQLLDLAEEINRLEGVLGHDAEYRRNVDNYAAQLTLLASGPLIESLDEALAIVAEPASTPSGLTVIRGGA